MGTTMIPPAFNSGAETGLQKSLRVRMARAALLHRMGAKSPLDSCRMAADIVGDVPEVLETLMAFRLLEAVARIGSETAERILDVCGVEFTLTLSELSERQRISLESALRNRAEFGQGGGR